MPESSSLIANIPDYTSYNWKLGNVLNSEVPIELITSKQEASQFGDQVNGYLKSNNEESIESIGLKQEVPQFLPGYNYQPSQLFTSNVKFPTSPELSYLNLYSSNLDKYRVTPTFQSTSDYVLPKLEVPSYQSFEPQAAFSHQSFSIQPQNIHQGIAFSSGNPSYISNDQYDGYGTAFSHKIYHVVPAPLAKRSTNVKA